MRWWPGATVLLNEGEDVLECERLEVNIMTRTGKVYQAKLFLKDQNFHIVGKEASKLGEGSYRIRDGAFTTCDASSAALEIHGKGIRYDDGRNRGGEGPRLLY